MQSMKYVLALDQGTTSSRSILFDHDGNICASSQKEFKHLYPHPGWVEHDPYDLWNGQQKTAIEAVRKVEATPSDIVGIGITNQRETTVVWNRKTGEPICNAISWQDRRTVQLCNQFKRDGINTILRAKTGLMMIPYFSATKIRWILDNIPGAQEQADRGELAFGTIDSWLLWKLSEGQLHITDVTNAARTLLFNIHTREWDDELLNIFNIPKSMLPKVCTSSEVYGKATAIPELAGVPISGIAGDQQAALFGQFGFQPGSAKITYGTGCFLMLNTGEHAVKSSSRLLTTIAWHQGDKPTYAIEGSVFIGGAVVQWLRDQLGIINSAEEIETLASLVPDNGGVHFVPAFAGLGAPHWNPYARGTITGLTRGSGKAHIARAALEAISFQCLEVLRAMEQDSIAPMETLQVDGGASNNNLLMQIQADLLQINLIRPKVTETTAFGAAGLAGLATGFWSGFDELAGMQKIDRIFEPKISADEAAARLEAWSKAVEHAQALESGR